MYKKIIEHFGERHQILKAIEELSELSIELVKALNGDENREDLLSELADVLNMVEQLKIIYNFSEHEIFEAMEFKKSRTIFTIKSNAISKNKGQ